MSAVGTQNAHTDSTAFTDLRIPANLPDSSSLGTGKQKNTPLAYSLLFTLAQKKRSQEKTHVHTDENTG
jgi:hypothetical protein